MSGQAFREPKNTMSKRTVLSVSAAVVAALTICVPALATETSPSGAEAGAAAPPPEAPVAKKAAPVPRPAPADDPYRCHPSQDVSCTVVRETSQGTLIVTMRPKGQSGRAPAWIVVSGAPPSGGPHRGGTVYVVPSDADAEPMTRQAALMPPNGAPILD